MIYQKHVARARESDGMHLKPLASPALELGSALVM